MGVSGVAPSRAQVEAWTRREADVAARGGMALPPDAGGAVPARGAAATHGLRTLPPRENGGNFDVKQLTRGSRLYLPVAVDGALFSTGDGHFAQGDGEVCVTAVEMGATCVVRFRVHKGEAARRGIRFPRFAHGDYFTDPRWAAPRHFVATMGMPVDAEGVNHGEDLNLACRNALLAMLDLLGERGLQPGAGLRDRERGGRPPDQQRRGRPERDRLGAPAGGHLPGLRQSGPGQEPHRPLLSFMNLVVAVLRRSTRSHSRPCGTTRSSACPGAVPDDDAL